jgi:hypothetical protein
MTTIALKKKIHECVDNIDDSKLLDAVYTILNTRVHSNDFELSKEDIEIIEGRKKNIQKGKEKLYTVAEVKRKILKNLGK